MELKIHYADGTSYDHGMGCFGNLGRSDWNGIANPDSDVFARLHRFCEDVGISPPRSDPKVYVHKRGSHVTGVELNSRSFPQLFHKNYTELMRFIVEESDLFHGMFNGVSYDQVFKENKIVVNTIDHPSEFTIATLMFLRDTSYNVSSNATFIMLEGLPEMLRLALTHDFPHMSTGSASYYPRELFDAYISSDLLLATDGYRSILAPRQFDMSLGHLGGYTMNVSTQFKAGARDNMYSTLVERVRRAANTTRTVVGVFGSFDVPHLSDPVPLIKDHMGLK